MLKYVCFLVLLFSAANVFSQSKSQVADRHIKSSIVKTTDNRKGNSFKTVLTRYDKYGNSIEVVEYNEDSVIVKWEKAEYTKRGDELWRIVLDKNGNQTNKTVYSYDKWNNLISEFKYGTTNDLVEKTEYKYDKFNDKTEEIVYSKDGKLITKTTYEYDKLGMISAKKIYNSDNKIIYKREYTYVY